jgi:predicted nucleotidyltransferase
LVHDALRDELNSDLRIAYALLFGSSARRVPPPHSDVDIALGLVEGARLDVSELGDLASRLETAASRPVDLVLLNEAPAGLAYRVFRDGVILLERDRAAMVARKARAILEYLDFQPVEEACARGVLAQSLRG